MKRAIIVHGWDGHPQEGWFPWLKSELERNGFVVDVPQLPEPETPRIENWVPALATCVGVPDKDTHLIGHSMGCQTIARYLASLNESIEIGGVVYVAGFFDSLTLGSGEEEEVWATWHDTPLDLTRVRARAPRSVAIFSDDDPYVPISNSERFKNDLGSDIRIFSGKRHFSEESGCFELPAARDAVLELAGVHGWHE